MTGAPARVLVVCCPGWPAAGVDPGREAGVFEQVVSVVEDFCPQVEVLRPGACAFSARGPSRYFGGEQALASKIIEALAGQGFDCQIGIADGLFAAERAARQAEAAGFLAVGPGQARAFLAPQPVSVLPEEDLASLLPRLGICTLGEFTRLPAAGTANRFGSAGVRARRLALGLDPRPLAPRPPSADLSACTEFDPPQQQAEPVVFAAKALAGRLHAGLAAAGLTCVRVRVEVTGENGLTSQRLWRHDGLLSALAVAERVRWQLAGWRSGAEGGRNESRPDESGRDGGRRDGGIVLLRLTPDQLVRDEGRQLGLWGDAVVGDRVARAALQVQAMLGHSAVLRPVLAGGRGPAEQVTLVPFGDAAEPGRPPDRPWPGRIAAPAPATVYPGPLPARVTDEEGAGVSVTGRAMISAPPARLAAGGHPAQAVTAWAGPWPADERWWQPGGARRRARFQLVTEDGTAWLVAVREGQWLVEARYD